MVELSSSKNYPQRNQLPHQLPSRRADGSIRQGNLWLSRPSLPRRSRIILTIPSWVASVLAIIGPTFAGGAPCARLGQRDPPFWGPSKGRSWRWWPTAEERAAPGLALQGCAAGDRRRWCRPAIWVKTVHGQAENDWIARLHPEVKTVSQKIKRIPASGCRRLGQVKDAGARALPSDPS